MLKAVINTEIKKYFYYSFLLQYIAESFYETTKVSIRLYEKYKILPK